jgi:hypothetical protein
MSDQSCSACGAHVSSYDGVWVGYKEGAKFLCSRCYNESMADEDDVVRGQISEDPDSFECTPLLIIDGKPVTWEALGRMLAVYAGFRFKLDIFDSSEER